MRKEKSVSESPERLNRLVESSKIVGDLFADSNLRIDGEVNGNVSTSSKVVLGENGKLKGNLTCMEADIEGNIEGKIKVEGLLIIRSKAVVNGDIYTLRIQMEEGAKFNGICKMTKNEASDNLKMSDLNEEPSVVY